MNTNNSLPDNPLDLANRMRRAGGGTPTDAKLLRIMCEDAARNGDIPHDLVTTVFRHLAFHAGIIRFGSQELYFCPICGDPLDTTDQ